MALVCGGDGTRRRAIWSTFQDFSAWRRPRRRDFNRTGDARGPAREEPGGRESEHIPNVEKYNCSTQRNLGGKKRLGPSTTAHWEIWMNEKKILFGINPVFPLIPGYEWLQQGRRGCWMVLPLRIKIIPCFYDDDPTSEHCVCLRPGDILEIFKMSQTSILWG